MSSFSAYDKLRCIQRELRFRRVVYEKRVHRGAMTQQQSDWEIGCMEAIEADYRAQQSNDGV